MEQWRPCSEPAADQTTLIGIAKRAGVDAQFFPVGVEIAPEDLMRLVKRLSIVVFNSHAKISKLKILPSN